ncbi:MAG: lipolytic protein family [Microvirga sp.]|jgi:lysophospholipase L1-like esterase|nr:lipolytic protein family [Microvirga sp.]
MLSSYAEAEGLKVVAYGTSLTEHGGWQEALQERLVECLKQPVTVATVAKSGAGSDWAATVVNHVVAEKPDVVLVEFATNDAALQRFISLKQSVANMNGILLRLQAETPPPRIFVMAMNPIHGMRGWVRPFLADYEAAHERLARDLGASFIDHRPAWARLSKDELHRAIPDGSHPAPEVTIPLIVPTIADAIAGSDCRK